MNYSIKRLLEINELCPVQEVEIAYSYSPSAPVLVQLKYYIDFIDVDDDDDGGGSVPKPTV